MGSFPETYNDHDVCLKCLYGLIVSWFSVCLLLIKLHCAIQRTSIRESNCVIQWIEIHLVDSIIYLLNKWRQKSYRHLIVCHVSLLFSIRTLY